MRQTPENHETRLEDRIVSLGYLGMGSALTISFLPRHGYVARFLCVRGNYRLALDTGDPGVYFGWLHNCFCDPSMIVNPMPARQFKPVCYGILEPDGTLYMSENCICEDKDVLRDEVLECAPEGSKIVRLYVKTK